MVKTLKQSDEGCWHESLVERLEVSDKILREYQLKEIEYKSVLKEALKMLETLKEKEKMVAGLVLSKKLEANVLRKRQKSLLERLHYQSNQIDYRVGTVTYHW